MSSRFISATTVAAAVTTIAIISVPVTAAAIELRFGHLGTEDTAYQTGAVAFKEKVEEYTNGDVTVAIFPGGVLGDEGELFEQQMAGALDVSIVNPGKMTDFSQTANIFSFPFLYRDVDHWNAVLDGELGTEIAEKITDETDVKILGYFGGGKRQIASVKPLQTVADLQGLKLRDNPTEPLIRAWESLGAVFTNYAYAEVYTGLQLRAIEAIANEAEWIHRMRFHEVAPHIGLSEHDITVRLLTMAGTTWNALSDEQQEAITRAATEAAQIARRTQIEEDQAALDLVVQEGATLYELDRAEMEKTVGPVLQQVAERMNLDDLYARFQDATQ